MTGPEHHQDNARARTKGYVNAQLSQGRGTDVRRIDGMRVWKLNRAFCGLFRDAVPDHPPAAPSFTSAGGSDWALDAVKIQ